MYLIYILSCRLATLLEACLSVRPSVCPSLGSSASLKLKNVKTCIYDAAVVITWRGVCRGERGALNGGFMSLLTRPQRYCYPGSLVFIYNRPFPILCFPPFPKAWRLILPSIPFVFCLLVALSRTCDYHHHWQDVTVGSLLGFLIAYASFRQYMCKANGRDSLRKTSSKDEDYCDSYPRTFAEASQSEVVPMTV